MRVVKVRLGARSYSILVAAGLLSRTGAECRKLSLGERCAVITDRNVEPLFGARVLTSLRSSGFSPVLITVAAGEKAKSLDQAKRCYDHLAAHRLERKSFIVALGGGVVGDLAGFVAGTYLRGIPFVQVPTTLLAQVDSSVGGKVGVNLKAGKNLVGAFHQPGLVLCDLETLRTLPEREFRAGLAEVIKYGVIYDAALFRRLERDLGKLVALSPDVLSSIIARCCQIKAAIVAQDETETGLRAILNFGHTIGHAIENSVGYGNYLHGEAIAIGQAAAAQLSEAVLGLPGKDAVRITNLLFAAGLPTGIRLGPAQRERLLRAMRLDKKVSSGEVKFVLTERIGKVRWGCKVPASLLAKALNAPLSTLR
jgi:3-dehydroquinate synthase